MIEIGRHIVPLLFSNDCVIIPDFGGFIVHHVDALYDETVHAFYPPRKTLGFNPQLKINDSVLAQSYAETYDISFPEATKRLEQDVRNMVNAIQKDGFYELEDLGVLRLNDDGKYEFEPYEAGILTPMLYGFGLLECQKLTPAAIEKEQPATPIQVNIPEVIDEQEPTSEFIKVPVRWVKYAAVACVAALIVMLIPIPANTIVETFKAGQIDSSLLYRILPKTTTEGEQMPVVNAPKKTVSLKPTVTKQDTVAIVPVAEPEVEAEPAIEEQPTPHFSIVLASRVSQKNAEYYVERIAKAGYTEGRVVEMTQGYRVLYGKYTTEEEAQAKRRSLGKNDLFDGCWVLETVD